MGLTPMGAAYNKWKDILDKLWEAYPQLNVDDFRAEEKKLLADYQQWPVFSSDLYAGIVLYLLACYEKFDMIQEGLDFFDKELSDFKKHCEYAYPKKAEIYDILARLYLRVGDTEKAEEAVKTGLYNRLINNVSWSDYEFASFRAFTDYAEQDLINNTLSAVHPSMFNDLWDTPLMAWSENQIEKETDSLLKEYLTLRHKAMNHIKVRCFARDTALPFNIGDRSNKKIDISKIFHPMWAYYAADHSGFCAVYAFPSEFVLNNDDETRQWTLLGNIQYGPAINLDTDDITYRDALLYKIEDWKNEHEVRIVHYDPEEKAKFKLLQLPEGCLQAVYFGVRCDRLRRDKLIVRLPREVETYQMIPDKRKAGRLIPQKIDRSKIEIPEETPPKTQIEINLTPQNELNLKINQTKQPNQN